MPAARSSKGIALVLKMPSGLEIAVTDSRSRPARQAAGRFSIWYWRCCVPLPSCNVPKFRFSVVPPSAKAAAAWPSTVSVAVAVCERLEAFGSLPLKETVVTPGVFEVAGTVQDWLALGARLPVPEVIAPSVALPLKTAAVRL